MNKGYNKAFTIAELLITLAIIGVVAAFTIRSVVVNTNKLVTETRLKKAFSELSHALDLGVMKNGNINEDEFSCDTDTDIFDIYFKPYLKTEKTCKDGKGRDCGYAQGRFWKRRDLNYEQEYSQTSDNHRTMTMLQDGMVILFNPYHINNGCQNDREIIVDIDGPKGRNLFGRDVFIFTIDFEKSKVLPKHYNDKTLEELKKKCIETGHWCAAWIAKSSWKIPDGYPW